MLRLYKMLKRLWVFAFAAGTLLFFGGWQTALPRATYIDGVDVGGMARTAAVAAVRKNTVSRLKDKRLTVRAGEWVYTFAYPQFNFTDDLGELCASVRGPGSYFSHTRVYLNCMDIVVEDICSRLDSPVREPSATFCKMGRPFLYDGGCDGCAADRGRLARDIVNSINGEFCTVEVQKAVIRRTVSLDVVKRETQLLSSFDTLYDASNAPRSSNIALAASKINGCVLQPGQIFSFNAVVGPRTAQNGFLSAKIISGGRFVQGIGGGVCQVSTTLYNAALLSGLKITEYHPHSLLVSYVAPSRDAMVSGSSCDLKFKNTSNTPVYIRAGALNGRISCSVYGLPDGASRSLVSQVTGSLPQPQDVLMPGVGGVITQGRQGTLSCGYLVEERGGTRTKTLIRTDRYAPLATVRYAETPPPADETFYFVKKASCG